MPIYEIPVLLDAHDERRAYAVAAQICDLLDDAEIGEAVVVEDPVLRVSVEAVLNRLGE